MSRWNRRRRSIKRCLLRDEIARFLRSTGRLSPGRLFTTGCWSLSSSGGEISLRTSRNAPRKSLDARVQLRPKQASSSEWGLNLGGGGRIESTNSAIVNPSSLEFSYAIRSSWSDVTQFRCNFGGVMNCGDARVPRFTPSRLAAVLFIKYYVVTSLNTRKTPENINYLLRSGRKFHVERSPTSYRSKVTEKKWCRGRWVLFRKC